MKGEEMFNNEEELTGAKIKVIGVGGGGSNAVNQMIESGVSSAEFACVNTDRQALRMSLCDAENRIQIGAQLTKGLGAGADPAVGEAAAEESKDELEKLVEGVDLLFIAAGMGGGTGTGAAPVIAKIAKDKGCLTVAVVTKPFSFECRTREENARKGISNLKKYVDTIIIVPNDKLLEALPADTPLQKAFKAADDTLLQGVCAIADLIAKPATINLDFADVRTIIKNQGLAHMGVGRAKGENRVLEAVRQAVSSPLLETTIEGASRVILNVTGSKDITMGEVNEAATLVRQVIDSSANMILGFGTSPEYNEEIIITIIATGFAKKGDSADIAAASAAVGAPFGARTAQNPAVGQPFAATRVQPQPQQAHPAVGMGDRLSQGGGANRFAEPERAAVRPEPTNPQTSAAAEEAVAESENDSPEKKHVPLFLKFLRK